MSDSAVLHTEDLTKKFGELVAVDGVSWSVDAGATKAIIGPNGAGKSTFFNLVSGVLSPTSGNVSFNGEPIASKKEHEIARLGLIKTFQQTNIYEESTVFENIRIAAQMKETTFNMWARADSLTSVTERTEEILSRLGLDAERDRTASDLPHGLQRKVEVGIALATEPDVILFDEPIAGMSEEGRHEMLEVLSEISADPSLTIVITEHDFDFIMDIADEVTVLHQGAVLTEGTPDEITKNDQVQEVYLGGE
ncbi:ABC transporter ATP-binding protein [Halorientalis marina]|jgi:branched-chain amino acid transport system ATP-binding protein|uniref:ABC transporter ATP-binding protein n=1 Tax=Halorientalis marina TaxID=2931976 RepID=UPI001FF59D52|nr:ABC transporter ATP-binding protein [Halorientalis marina]